MGVIDFSEALNSAIQAGQVVEGNVVKIIADNGTEVGDAVFKVIEGGNGVAQEVGVATTAGTGGAVATGMGILALDVGVVGAAIAPALGIAVGATIGDQLYNLDPQFWIDVSDALFEAGYTVGGKVISYWNGANAFFDQGVIEIFKNLLVNYGVFEEDKEIEDYTPPAQTSDYNLWYPNLYSYPIPWNTAPEKCYNYNGTYITIYGAEYNLAYRNPYTPDQYSVYSFSRTDNMSYYNSYDGQVYPITASYYEFGGVRWYYNTIGFNYPSFAATLPYFAGANKQNAQHDMILLLFYNSDIVDNNPFELQPNATYPNSEEEFPLTYPNWEPHVYPQTVPPPDLPVIYPIKYPEIGPEGYPDQEGAQDPNPESPPEIYPKIIPNFDIPEPGIPTPPEPEPDPDPQPDPDPIEEPESPSIEKDPPGPNTPPVPSPPIVVPSLPSTVSSSKLFTVYNPGSSQLDALGGYLWDASIMASIRDIWQDPLDGIISLIQVYCSPSTGSNKNIILGYLDTGISCPVVSSQFVTIDCGSVQIKENKKNATDYSPYVSIHVYLPFVGIVELDTNECMNSTMTITYKVDVYTGTCLATISITRTEDMPEDPILYTYNGNCSQQIPLTSGNATGVLTALIGGATAAISVASGGGLSTLAGAQLLGNSLTHEMFHVQHSGNISANAGIMGNKKPYVIIGRQHCYDATNYSSFYGYPANKNVNLGNHTGFVRVKKCWLKTSATQPEYEKIMELLEEGVFV